MSSAPSLVRFPQWMWILLIVVATSTAYYPAWHGGLLNWDDTEWITRLEPHFQDIAGLVHLWTHPTVMQQYYPVTATSFWIDHQLWGAQTMPMHVENVLLHALNAVLFWRLLVLLRIPGAPLACAIFALHPMMAESVAWITERKNVLSLALCLASIHAYGRSVLFWQGDAKGGKLNRGLSAVLFLLALLAKSSVVTMPILLLTLAWWKRDGLRFRRDIQLVLPFFALSTLSGILTIWLETHHVGAEGEDFAMSISERCLVACRALWFYPMKLIWPADLNAIYPRWQFASEGWIWSLCSVATLGSLLLGWRWRKRHPGLVAAILCYAVSILPVLGFINVYGMLYTFVADRWFYFPSLGLIALLGAGLSSAFGRLVTLLPPMLAVLTWTHAGVFSNDGLLWSSILSGNPNCWVAMFNQGNWLASQGRNDEAARNYERTLELRPNHLKAHNNLGNQRMAAGDATDALKHFEAALKLSPDFAISHYQAGNALLALGRAPEALESYERALAIDDTLADAHNNLGSLLFQSGHADEALTHFEAFASLKPDDAAAHANLGVALAKVGRRKEAIQHYERALAINSGQMAARSNLAWLLATAPEEGLRDGPKAIDLALQADRATNHSDPSMLRTLAAAYAEIRQFEDAIDSASRAVAILESQGHAPLANVIKQEIAGYKASRPLRE